MIKRFALSTALTLSLALSACAQSSSSTALGQTDIEKIVKAYLLENPEIIREALIALEEKEDLAAITNVADDLFHDSRDVSVGPKDAKVTIVEFFDYNCGFCKRSTDWVKSVMEEHPDDVRIVFKELPILDGRSQTSKLAARGALAAARQGAYTRMHFALMDARSLSPERIEKIAESLDLDMVRFKKDMKDPEIKRHIDDTISLAQRIPPLSGTPFFVINEEFISGANTDALQSLLDQALKS